MELPVKKLHYSADIETHYNIKVKNLSYKLSAPYGELDLFGWKSGTISKSNTKYVLENISCDAKPGELTAIAGPSGAGKTTLLEILAGTMATCRVSGRVLVNDMPMNAAHFCRVSGYVTQDEALFPHLTVEETLMYSARLRLQAGRDKARSRVHSLLKELGLEHIAGVRIGSETSRGISGGEKRRVSIGVDLVHDPAVLLLDEPTSGLDSASALHVVLLLTSMAKNQGKTIVLTIHQPGFRILDLIDKVILLSNGVVLHSGSLELLAERLKSGGYCIPQHVNALEFAIEVTESLHKEENGIKIESGEIQQDRDHETLNQLAEGKKIFYCNSPSKEILILAQRFSKNIFRTKQLFAAKTVEALVAGIVLGTIFINVFGNSKTRKMQNQLGFFAFTLTFLISSTTEALPIFLQERRILMRETSRGVYRVSSYIIANTLVFVPFLLIVSLLYTCSVYWLVGLRRNIDGFLYFSLVVWLAVLTANSFVACFSTVVPNFIMGMSFIYGVIGSFFLFSGYFISKDTVPKYWKFMHYLSLFKYPYECFMINEFGGEKGKLRCLEGTEDECVVYGNQFLMQVGLKESQKWSNLITMLSFIFGYRLLGLLFLWYRSYRSTS
ncbi:ABC transporter G family member 10 [Sesamum alatum]|uniref:ABC transporter G family member 10 n=1 Tax=Sesamum alatum TaxID=300844 RepID=A0AAE1YYU8_9LAMI|nr:ABC transporter G family member 10 [Sesamum alatum]